MYRDTIPKVKKIKTQFYSVCDSGSSAEYFETFLNLPGAELTELQQFEIADEKSNVRENCD